MRLSKTASTLVALVAALSLTACGDETSDEDAAATTSSIVAPSADSAGGDAGAPNAGGSPGETEPGAAPPGGGTGSTAASSQGSNPSADREAKSDLRNAFTAAKVIATDHEGRFEKDDAGNPIDAAALSQENASEQYGPSGSASIDVVSVLVRDVSGRNSDIWLVKASSPRRFFCIHGNSMGEVSFGLADSEPGAVAACGGSSWPPD